VETWIAPRAKDIGERIAGIEAVRRLRSREAVKAVFASEGGRWPLLFFAVWSLIHLEDAQPDAALAALAGR